MAEAVVRLVLGRLTDEVIKELIFLNGVQDKVERVQRDLTWIQSFLKDADSNRHKNERVKNWVNEVKEVSYLIEDTLDKLSIEVNGSRSQEHRLSLKRIVKMVMKQNAKHKLGKEIDKIQQRIDEISKNRTTYGIEGLKDDSAEASSNLPVRSIMIPDIDETEVIGFEEDRKKIVNQLTDTNITRRSMLSIVGAGGSGKTTLAKEVYMSPEINQRFTIRLWLTASQEYKLIDILFKMLKKIGCDDLDEQEKGDQEYLISKLYNSMKVKKYLVVLDDVWSIDLWTQLKVALPDINNGSRVLITTRSHEIAKKADARSKPHEIRGLNEKESQQLLLKHVFPNQYADECPQDLLSLVPDFAKKCGGWPLALVVLGGILSGKIPSYDAWDEVMRKMDWHTDGSQCMGVISTSYEFLPNYLKPCFMYFAAFPEDHQIKASTLIQLWTGEELILPNASKTMEQIAESYLEELVQRCMVQVSSRSLRGKIKYCHVHDLLRELAIQKAMEDNFLTVFSENGTHSSNNNSARRVSLNFCGYTPLNHACANLRSLTYFGDQTEISKRCELLRVLNVQSSGYLRYDQEWLKNLTFLRYFGLRRPSGWTKSCKGFYRPVPYSGLLSHLTHTKYLQTVDLPIFCKAQVLPPSFWDNKLLRHVIFKPCFTCGGVQLGPPASADLPNLQTLKWVAAPPEWVLTCCKVREGLPSSADNLPKIQNLKSVAARQERGIIRLPHFPKLRKLAVILIFPLTLRLRYNKINSTVDLFVNSLNKLQDLDSLSLIAHNEYSYENVAFPCFISEGHNHLHSFRLVKSLWGRRGCIQFPPHLVKIKLLETRFYRDPMPQLEKLPNLRALHLHGSMENAEQVIICSRGGFGRLEMLLLVIFNFELKEWKIEEGAMPMLNRLKLSSDILENAPDLQYLTSLQQLKVLNSREVDSENCHNADQWKWEIINLKMLNSSVGSEELSHQ